MPHYEMGTDMNLNEKTGWKKPVKKKNSNLLLAKYANVGYYVVTPLFVGVFLGVAMDHWLKTKPFFTIVFLLFGVVGTFYNLYKLTQDTF